MRSTLIFAVTLALLAVQAVAFKGWIWWMRDASAPVNGDEDAWLAALTDAGWDYRLTPGWGPGGTPRDQANGFASVLIMPSNVAQDPGQYFSNGNTELITRPWINMRPRTAFESFEYGPGSATLNIGSDNAGRTPLHVLNPTHPFFAGVTFDANNETHYYTASGASGLFEMVTNGASLYAANTMALPGAYPGAGPLIASWNKGDSYYPGSPGPVAGGRRVFYNVPSKWTDLNPTGQKIFFNMLNFLVPGRINNTASFVLKTGSNRQYNISFSRPLDHPASFSITGLPSQIGLTGSIGGTAGVDYYTVLLNAVSAVSGTFTVSPVNTIDPSFVGQGPQFTSVSFTMVGGMTPDTTSLQVPRLGFGSRTITITTSQAVANGLTCTFTAPAHVTTFPANTITFANGETEHTIQVNGSTSVAPSSGEIVFNDCTGTDPVLVGSRPVNVLVTIPTPGTITANITAIVMEVTTGTNGPTTADFTLTVNPLSTSSITVVIQPPAGVTIQNGNTVVIPPSTARVTVRALASATTVSPTTLNFAPSSSNDAVYGGVQVTPIPLRVNGLLTIQASPLTIAIFGFKPARMQVDMNPAPTLGVIFAVTFSGSLRFPSGDNYFRVEPGSAQSFFNISGGATAGTGDITFGPGTSTDPLWNGYQILTPKIDFVVVQPSTCTVQKAMIRVPMRTGPQIIARIDIPGPTNVATTVPIFRPVNNLLTDAPSYTIVSPRFAQISVSWISPSAPGFFTLKFGLTQSSDARYDLVQCPDIMVEVIAPATFVSSVVNPYLTISNNAPLPIVSLTGTTFCESSAQFTVTYPAFATGPALLVIPAGNNTGSIQVVASGTSTDFTAQGNLTFSAAVSTDEVCQTATPPPGGYIFYRDIGNITVPSTTIVAILGGGTRNITISLTSAPASEVWVPLNSVGTASVTIQPNMIRFAPGQTTYSVRIIGSAAPGTGSITAGPAVSQDGRFNGRSTLTPCTVQIRPVGIVSSSLFQEVTRVPTWNTIITLAFNPAPTQTIQLASTGTIVDVMSSLTVPASSATFNVVVHSHDIITSGTLNFTVVSSADVLYAVGVVPLSLNISVVTAGNILCPFGLRMVNGRTSAVDFVLVPVPTRPVTINLTLPSPYVSAPNGVTIAWSAGNGVQAIDLRGQTTTSNPEQIVYGVADSTDPRFAGHQFTSPCPVDVGLTGIILPQPGNVAVPRAPGRLVPVIIRPLPVADNDISFDANVPSNLRISGSNVNGNRITIPAQTSQITLMVGGILPNTPELPSQTITFNRTQSVDTALNNIEPSPIGVTVFDLTRITVSPATIDVPVSGQATVTVTAAAPVSSAVTIALTRPSGATLAGGAMVTILAGQTTASVVIQAGDTAAGPFRDQRSNPGNELTGGPDLLLGTATSNDINFHGQVPQPNFVPVTITTTPETNDYPAALISVLITRTPTDRASFSKQFIQDALRIAQVPPCLCSRVLIFQWDVRETGPLQGGVVIIFGYIANDKTDGTPVDDYRERFINEWRKKRDNQPNALDAGSASNHTDPKQFPGSFDNAAQCTAPGVCDRLDCSTGQVYYKGLCYNQCPYGWSPDAQRTCRADAGWDVSANLIVGVVLSLLALGTVIGLVMYFYKRQLKKGGSSPSAQTSKLTKVASNSELTLPPGGFADA